jgi:hypothetical protein
MTNDMLTDRPPAAVRTYLATSTAEVTSLL